MEKEVIQTERHQAKKIGNKFILLLVLIYMKLLILWKISMRVGMSNQGAILKGNWISFGINQRIL